MTRIIRWNPYREMNQLLNAMDRRVDSRYLSPRYLASQNWGVAVDVSESEDEYLIKIVVIIIVFVETLCPVSAEIENVKIVSPKR